MTDLPKHIDIHEEGPREGFQIEPGPISTADKIKLIEALAETGLHHIQAASFVSPKIVPGWADAEDVVAGFTPKEGVHYTGLWCYSSQERVTHSLSSQRFLSCETTRTQPVAEAGTGYRLTGPANPNARSTVASSHRLGAGGCQGPVSVAERSGAGATVPTANACASRSRMRPGRLKSGIPSPKGSAEPNRGSASAR
jgi:hypothetical protein